MSHDRFKIDVDRSPLAPVARVVAIAQREFNAMLSRYADSGALRKETYIRYLSFQHHLTANVQRAFLAVAAHPSLANRRELREFLFSFALEEEPHSAIAERDLSQLGHRPLDCPLDVKLWWSYFNEVIPQTPFVPSRRDMRP